MLGAEFDDVWVAGELSGPRVFSIGIVTHCGIVVLIDWKHPA